MKIDQSRTDKGLINKQGENTCFLNVVIQALWHLPAFRERLLALHLIHTHPPDKLCILCPLANLFSQFRYSRKEEIPPGVLRETLAALHKGDGRFQVGEQEDCHEALNEILNWFHCDSVQADGIEESLSIVCQPKCIAHECFGTQVCTLRCCRTCNATSEPETTDQFLFSVYASDLGIPDSDFYTGFRVNAPFSCPQQLNREDSVKKESILYLEDVSTIDFGEKNIKLLSQSDRFEVTSHEIKLTMIFPKGKPDFSPWRKELDRQFYAVYEFVELGGTVVVPKLPQNMMRGSLLESGVQHALGGHLPMAFQKQLQAQLDHLVTVCPGPAFQVPYCFSTPCIITINVVWPTEEIDRDLMSIVHRKVPERVHLHKIVRCERAEPYSIRAIAGYYGRHYIAFCWSPNMGKWLKFDDNEVKIIGPKFSDVVKWMTGHHWRMTVLFYETMAPQPQAYEIHEKYQKQFEEQKTAKMAKQKPKTKKSRSSRELMQRVSEIDLKRKKNPERHRAQTVAAGASRRKTSNTRSAQAGSAPARSSSYVLDNCIQGREHERG